MYHRLGHVNKIYVKAGDKISVGKLVATNGTGNGQWKAHCHYDIFREKQSNWMRYNIGWTKADTLNVWENPTPYYKKVMPNFDHFGWEFLEKAMYKNGACWHPGVDLNGPGAGNADFDDPLYSPVDGVIEYIYEGNLSNGGWGRVIIIKEEKMANEYEKNLYKLYNGVQDLLKRNDGDNPNNDETKEMLKELEDIKKLLKNFNPGNAELEKKLVESEAKLAVVTEERNKVEAKLDRIQNKGRDIFEV